MDLLLNDKAALVTGGGRGIGQAIAVALARQGVHVAVCGRARVPLEATAALVETHGVKRRGDRRGSAGPRRLPACGRGDRVIVRSVGHPHQQCIDERRQSPADLEGVTDAQLMEQVNGKGMASVRVTRAALPRLRASGQGGSSCSAVFRHGGRPGSRVCRRSRQCLRRRCEASQRRRRAGRHHGERDPSRSDEDGSPPPRIEALAARLGVSYGEAEAARDAGFRSDGWSRRRRRCRRRVLRVSPVWRGHRTDDRRRRRGDALRRLLKHEQGASDVSRESATAGRRR